MIAMNPSETIHRYPRAITVVLESIAALLIALATAAVGRTLLRGLWDLNGIDMSLIGRIPFLPETVQWIDSVARVRVAHWQELIASLLPGLAWLALALLVGLLLRNALPIVRISREGLLVAFGNSWMPIGWEHLHAIDVTADAAGERFILLIQTDRSRLTGWHRFYSLFYGLRGRPGFYITSRIFHFDQLLQGILNEQGHYARGYEGVAALKVREEARSLIFGLLLNPGAFFSAPPAETTETVQFRPGDPIRATYPARIRLILNSTALIAAIMLVWQYLSYWVRFLALSFPGLRSIAPFSWTLNDPAYIELYNAFRTRAVPFMGVVERPDLPAPFWLLITAHLMLIIAVPLLTWIYNMLPALETRTEGLAVQPAFSRRWRVIPWEQITSFKLTEFSEESQVLLLQTRSRRLTPINRLTSLIYDGSTAPGLLITSAITNFQPLVQEILERLDAIETAHEQTLIRQEAHSWVLWLTVKPQDALATLIGEQRADERTRAIATGPLLRAAGPMAALALLPALMVLAGGLFDGDYRPGLGLLFTTLIIWIIGMVEWPLIGIVSVLLDDNTGGGEEGYRALYVYPISQLPRVLPLLAALLFQILGVVALPIFAWIGAIILAYWISTQLWTLLYEWEGSQTVLGGLLPVFWQLLLVLIVLIIQQ
jgi:hypothetical protein